MPVHELSVVSVTVLDHLCLRAIMFMSEVYVCLRMRREVYVCLRTSRELYV